MVCAVVLGSKAECSSASWETSMCSRSFDLFRQFGEKSPSQPL
jgi:hypothetical protein